MVQQLLFAGLAAGMAAAAGAPAAYRYEVTAGPAARTLEVDARFAPGSGGVLVVERGLEAYVAGARLEDAGGWRQLARSGATLLAPECESRGCRIRYRVELGRAARELDDLHRALERQGTLLAPPSSWLLRPLRAREGRYRFTVAAPPGVRFVSGVSPAPDGSGAYENEIDTLERAAYSGFGAFAEARVELPGGEVALAIAPGERRLSNQAIERWVARSAGAVSGYFGRLPVARALVMALPGGRRPVGFGTMLAGGGAAVMVFLGGQAGEDDLARDWVLVHELAHLGFPDLSGTPSWVEEGLATYVEPIARAQAGLLSQQELWRELVQGLPRGQGGDSGLDSARGYARSYWGGALYWLLCDLELRERTGNARGLQDVLRSVLAAGGDAQASWTLERALDELERAAGQPAFRARLRRMAREPAREDLEALWRRLGVALHGERVAFDDAAPLAGLRRSLGEGPRRPAAVR